MVLGRQQTSEHSNEITAIPALLDLLKVKGRIEVREYYHSDEFARSIGMVRATRIMSFREDDSHMRTGYSAENFGMMRRMALSIMKRDTHSKRSLKGRRRICSYHDKYFEQLLFNSDDTISQVRPG